LVEAIVSGGESVRVLCTSRQRLGVAGESIVIVSPLGIPDPANHATVATLRDADAISLLVERAQAVAPDFALTEENCDAASEICRRLDGLPLAIELASVRLASLSADDLLARLDDRFRLLWTEGRQQSRRHQALRATVEWSYELLSEEEQILWRRLSVFAGSFGLAAAEAVGAGTELEQDRIVDLVGRLVDRSILTMRQGRRTSRYRFLETMRMYGAAHLREAGEETGIQRRHATWCAELVSGGDRTWWAFGGHVDFVDAVDVEWASVESALEFCAGSTVDVPMGLRMATDLWTYWAARGRYRLGFRHLRKLLDLTPAPTPARAFGVWAMGWAAQAIGDDLAVEAFEEARRISEQTGADRELAYALMGLGAVRLRHAELTGALELFSAALRATEQFDDATSRAMILNFIATTLSIDGKPTEAVRFAREGLDLSAPGGDTMLHSLLGTLVGIIEWQLGDDEAAEAKLAEATRIRDRLDWVWGLAISLDGLAWVAASSGRLERSARLLGAVGSMWRQMGIAPVPYLQGHHKKCVTSVRTELGEARYHAYLEQGVALDRRALVAFALDDELPSNGEAVTTAGDEFELTSRELEVARLVAEGLSNPAIASALFVSVATVKTHVSHILQKLALDSRVQLARWSAAHALGTLPSGDR
jgi:predicted ATPase/DNA-binding CsgD family transcriptional regulator